MTEIEHFELITKWFNPKFHTPRPGCPLIICEKDSADFRIGDWDNEEERFYSGHTRFPKSDVCYYSYLPTQVKTLTSV